MVGWIVANIADASQSGRISKEVDAKFENRDLQTITMSEAALNQSFLGMFSAVLKAIDIVSVVITLIMALIVGNTIAMGVRERTNEYGVLRAIGFLPGHIARFILVEGVGDPRLARVEARASERRSGGRRPDWQGNGSPAG